MSITGSWNMIMKTPMGDQKAVLTVAADGSVMMTNPEGEAGPVDNPELAGDTLKFSVSVTKPMPIKLHFTVTADGDTLSGKMRPGMFPPSAVTGARA